MADYQRGTGPDALPQGGATAANAAVAAPAPGPQTQPQDPSGQPGARLQQDIPIEYGDPQKVASNDPSLSDNMQLLTGPSDPSFQAKPPQGGRVPAALVRALPLLAVASKSPDAPFALKAQYRAAVAAVERENGEFD